MGSSPEQSLSRIHWSALGLAAVTGLIHVYLFATESWIPFLLAGAGYLGAIGAFLLLGSYRRVIYAAGILFTVGQIAGYVLLPIGPVWIAVLDKSVQVVLIAVLAYLYVTENGRTPANDPGG